MTPSSTRGLRNNNPLNIRISAAKWLGKVPKECRTDPAFEQFSIPIFNDRGEQVGVQPFVPGDPEQRVWGYRAAIRNLRTYFRSCGCRTITDVVLRWAPASDGNNDPLAYIAAISRLTGWQEERVLHFEEVTICRLVSAMAQVESRVPFGQDDALIQRAWQLL